MNRFTVKSKSCLVWKTRGAQLNIHNSFLWLLSFNIGLKLEKDNYIQHCWGRKMKSEQNEFVILGCWWSVWVGCWRGGVVEVDCSTSMGRDGTVLLTSTETEIGKCPLKLSAVMLGSEADWQVRRRVDRASLGSTGPKKFLYLLLLLGLLLW